MYALLGNFEGDVNVPEMDGYVYFRAQVYHTVDGLPYMTVGVARNDNIVPPIYDLPVKIFNGEVTPMETYHDK